MRAENLIVYQGYYSHSTKVFVNGSFSLTKVTWPKGGIAQPGVRVLGKHFHRRKSVLGFLLDGCTRTSMIFDKLMATCKERDWTPNHRGVYPLPKRPYQYYRSHKSSGTRASRLRLGFVVAGSTDSPSRKGYW